MKQDIRDKIELDFVDPKEVLQILRAMESMNRGPVSDRVYRSIVFLSSGNKEKINYYVELAFKDIRDLYWQAEYEDPEIQKYDFSKSFVELGLL